MRTRWYLAVTVWIGLFTSSGLALAAPTQARQTGARLQVAQADMDPLMITAGAQNPFMTLEINDRIANLAALQIDLTALDQEVLVDTVTIGFGIPFGEEITTGNEDFLDVLQARLFVEDVNVNGMQDAGESLLGTQTITDLEDPDTVEYAIQLTIPAGTTTTLLVIIDVNQPVTQSASMQPSRLLTRAGWNGAMALLCVPLIAGVGYAYRRHPGSGHLWILVFVLLGCSLTVVGCATNNGDDELRFVVNLPSNGITSNSGLLGPESAIAGTTIRLMK